MGYCRSLHLLEGRSTHVSVSKHINDLSKNLAGGMSRRKAFGRFLAGIGGAVLLGKKAGAEGNNICVAFCRYQGLKGREFGNCVSLSAHCPPGYCANVVNGTSSHGFCVPVEV